MVLFIDKLNILESTITKKLINHIIDILNNKSNKIIDNYLFNNKNIDNLIKVCNQQKLGINWLKESLLIEICNYYKRDESSWKLIIQSQYKTLNILYRQYSLLLVYIIVLTYPFHMTKGIEIDIDRDVITNYILNKDLTYYILWFWCHLQTEKPLNYPINWIDIIKYPILHDIIRLKVIRPLLEKVISRGLVGVLGSPLTIFIGTTIGFTIINSKWDIIFPHKLKYICKLLQDDHKYNKLLLDNIHYDIKLGKVDIILNI